MDDQAHGRHERDEDGRPDARLEADEASAQLDACQNAGHAPEVFPVLGALGAVVTELDNEDDEDDGDLTNEDVRRLITASKLAGDHVASDDLYAYLLRKSYSRVRKVPDDQKNELRDHLVEAGLRGADAVLERVVPFPRNYVARTMANAWVSWLRHRAARPQAVVMLDTDEVPGGYSFEDDVLSRHVLNQLHELSSSSTERKLADLVEVMYHTGVCETEACRLLDYSRKEAENVQRTLRRRRVDTSSLLWRLRPDSDGHGESTR